MFNFDIPYVMPSGLEKSMKRTKETAHPFLSKNFKSTTQYRRHNWRHHERHHRQFQTRHSNRSRHPLIAGDANCVFMSSLAVKLLFIFVCRKKVKSRAKTVANAIKTWRIVAFPRGDYEVHEELSVNLWKLRKIRQNCCTSWRRRQQRSQQQQQRQQHIRTILNIHRVCDWTNDCEWMWLFALHNYTKTSTTTATTKVIRSEN